MNPTPRIAVVTGAGSGIGRACARALLEAGWQVALLGRRIETLEEARGNADFAQTLCIPTDVSDPASVQVAFNAIVHTWGRIDLLFNNAGVFTPGATPDAMSLDDWHQSVNTNLNGAFYCLRAAFTQMKQQSPQGGRIINNGSISAHAPRPGSSGYTATKHAITGLTKTAALDGRPFQIAVGQIDIGNVASDMTTAMARGVPQADGSIKAEAVMDMRAVTETFMNMATLPLSANVLFTTVMATNMPFVGRG